MPMLSHSQPQQRVCNRLSACGDIQQLVASGLDPSRSPATGPDPSRYSSTGTRSETERDPSHFCEFSVSGDDQPLMATHSLNDGFPSRLGRAPESEHFYQVPVSGDLLPIGLATHCTQLTALGFGRFAAHNAHANHKRRCACAIHAQLRYTPRCAHYSRPCEYRRAVQPCVLKRESTINTP